MLLNSERLVETKKNKNKVKVSEKLEQIYSDIDNSISEYINNFRIENKRVTLTVEQIKNISNEMKNIAELLLKNQKNEKIKEENFSKKMGKGLIISDKEARLIHEFINGDYIVENPNERFIESLRKVFDACIINNNTKLFSRNYFEKILLKKIQSKQKSEKKDYYTVYFHISCLKISNTIEGHSKTDENIEKISSSILEGFNKKVRLKNGNKINSSFFNTSPLSFNNNDNFLIDFNGGNLVAIIDEKNMPKNFNVEEFIINNIGFNNKEEILNVNASYKKVGYGEDLLKSIKELHKKVKEDKPTNLDLLSENSKNKLRVKILEECVNSCYKNLNNEEDKNKFLNYIELACNEKLTKISEISKAKSDKQ